MTTAMKGLQHKYQQELQAQNLAKSRQIKTLQQEVERLSNSHVKYAAVSYATCAQCKTKDNQISRLRAEVNQIKRIHQKQITELKKVMVSKQQTVYIDRHSSELEMLRKSYEELQHKYDEVLKRQWTTMKVDGREYEEESELRKRNRILEEEIEVLTTKLHHMQNRIYILEDANKSLREQIINQMNTKLSPPIVSKPIVSPPKNINFPHPTVIIHPPQQFPPPPIHNLNRGNSSTSNLRNLSRSPAKRNYREYKCTCAHVSPLSILEKDNQVHHQSSCMMSNFYEKDLLAERYNTLQRKIKHLEGQNTKLRSYVCPVHG